ncbi:hypothetical protein EI94DRAFT_1847586 [Lactarius quietus]|nr:hypothetical protein EI94DRAFT_1847586 [Lactarius quietus]
MRRMQLHERFLGHMNAAQPLIVHGRAVMVLHTSFTYQERTQDIDSIHRAFVKPEGVPCTWLYRL